MKILKLAAIACCAWFCIAPAFASAVFYADFPTWSAAVSNVTTVTIPDPGGFTFIGTGDASVVYSGITFSVSSTLGNGNFFNVGQSFSGDPAVLSDQEQSSGVANILITFPEAVVGFALNFGTFGGSDVTFLFSNGDTAVLPSPNNTGGYATPDFAGATDVPFTSVLLTTSDAALNINNISFATGSDLPEPAAGLLFAFGCAGLIGYGWRRRRLR